jgi:hypothetical protein
MTLCIIDTNQNNALHYGECHFVECHILFIVLLCVIMLNAVMLSVVEPSGITVMKYHQYAKRIMTEHWTKK